MNYIEIKEETLQVKKMVCSHQLVTKIWEYGGTAALPPNGEVFRFVCLLLSDGSKREFKDGGEGKAIEDAEVFLISLDTK